MDKCCKKCHMTHHMTLYLSSAGVKIQELTQSVGLLMEHCKTPS